MKQNIKIKFQKSPTQKHCKKCKWYCIYPFEQEDKYQIHECLLFGEQVEQNLRCKKCSDVEFYENDKRYLRYEIFQPDYETCGSCLLQYYYQLKDGYRMCPVFKKPLKFEQGLNVYGDDVYELHYRCTSCHNAVI